MRKIETVRDLVLEGLASHGSVRKLAESLYSSNISELTKEIDGFKGYNITLPVFANLGKHIQDFIIKSLYECKAEHLWKSQKPNKEDIDKVLAKLPFDPIPGGKVLAKLPFDPIPGGKLSYDEAADDD